jgi:1,2-diacylglycerol 3-alpha-glucosyltransferase
MRIGIFTDFSLPHIGGVETSVFHQHRALSDAGHKVFIISPPMKGADTIGDSVEGVLRLRSPLPIYFDGMGIYYWSRRPFKKIDKLQLDVVHVQSEYNTGCLGIKYARSRGLPLLYTAHTFYPPQIELFMSLPRTMAILATLGQRLMLGRYRSKKKFKAIDDYLGIPARTFAQRRILDVWMKFASEPDAILAPSQRMKQYMELYIKNRPVYYTPNPFNSLITDGHTVAQPVHEPIRMMTTSVMRPEKRPDVLIEAFALLTPEERQKLSLDMFGGGKMFNQLKGLIKRRGLEDYVHLHGPVDNRIIQRALMQSDVVISMSIGFDNQPMVILEGIHAGNVILYCDKYLTEGTHGSNAILADVSIEGFAEKLRQIIQNPEHITVMKQHSKQLARQYTYDSFVQNYNSILSAIVKE